MKNSLPEFGIAVYSPEEFKQLDRAEQFFHVEIPGDMLEISSIDLLKKYSGTYTLSVRDICSRKVLQELPDVPFGVKNDFYRYFSSKCKIMSECGISELALAVDAGQASHNTGYADALMEIMHCCFGITERNKINVSLELRIPGIDDETVAFFLDFRKKLLYPTGIMIDFHMHEPESYNRLENIAPDLAFNRNLWRMSFEAASGNYLGQEAVRKVLPWVTAGAGECGRVILAPGAGAEDGMMLSLSEAVGEILDSKTEGER